jgi:hypothetical protein
MDTLQANTQPGNIIKKYYCAFILAFLFFVSTYIYLSDFGQLFWDFSVYQNALVDYKNGINPYSPDGRKISFIYHPVFLDFFSFVPKNLIAEFFGAFYLLSIYIFAKAISTEQLQWFAISIPFAGIGVLSFYSGNVTVFLHLFLLANLLYCTRKNSWATSYYLIFAFSLIKPYFLAYLAIPAFYPSNKKLGPKIFHILSSLLIFILIGIFYYFNSHDLVRDFVSALHSKTLAKGDIGLAFYKYLFLATHNANLSLVVHSILSLWLLSTLYYSTYKIKNSSITKEGYLFIAYFILTIINPRLKEYDMYFAILALLLFTLINLPGRLDRYYAYFLSISAIPFIFKIAERTAEYENLFLSNSNIWMWITVMAILVMNLSTPASSIRWKHMLFNRL